MLDLDVVMSSRKGVAGCGFERPAARVIHFADE
jgi:hypothetical protein